MDYDEYQKYFEIMKVLDFLAYINQYHYATHHSTIGIEYFSFDSFGREWFVNTKLHFCYFIRKQKEEIRPNQ
jgi:hypothetical protein